jgi:hypothetical protein
MTGVDVIAFGSAPRHAVIRNFVTYHPTEKSLRPQMIPDLGIWSVRNRNNLAARDNPQMAGPRLSGNNHTDLCRG